MKSYPLPFNEPGRMSEVNRLSSLNVGEEPILNQVVEIVRKSLKVPSALVSIVDDDRQWFAARDGFPLAQTTKDYSICAHTILEPEPLIICDTHADPRFRDHPVVVNEPKIRFYAGAPIVLSSGFRIGSLCALDYVARDHPTTEAIETLEGLAQLTAQVLEEIGLSQPDTQPSPVDTGDAAKSAFLALIGHELRTPLTILFGSLKLVEATTKNQPGNSLVTSARKSAKHLMGLIETIISYSDLSTGDLRLNQTVCDLGALLKEAAGLTLPGADGTLRTITLSEDLLSAPVYIDREQILLALDALLLNAINHGGSDITLGSRQDEAGNIEIFVTDDGHVDDSVELARLYEPFVVGGGIDNRGTRGGLGLGLPLTMKLVELHGGELEVIARDQQTHAIIRLPAWRLEAVDEG